MSLNSWPHFDSDQIDSVTRVLASGKVNTWTGEETKAFDRTIEGGKVADADLSVADDFFKRLFGDDWILRSYEGTFRPSYLTL